MSLGRASGAQNVAHREVAFVALVGLGAYATLSEASEDIVKIHECIDPDPQTQSTYSESYERYRQTYFALLPLFEQSAGRTA